MAGELIRPGVEVLQTRKKTSPSFVRPTLAPCVVGPAFEVINVVSDDGTINSKAKFDLYSQLGRTIAQSEFPNPRGNIDQLDVIESTVRPFMLSGGSLSELLMAPGESFLVSSHGASRAAVQTSTFTGATGLAIQGLLLVLAIDNPVAADKSKDVTVTFTGTGNLTSKQCADQINTVVGKTVATVVGTAPTDSVQIASPASTVGAMSSVTIRAGGSANVLLGLGGIGGAHDERVEGSGYRGQDDNNNDTLTPWIEFYQGKYMVDGVDTVFAAHAGLINVETNTFVSAKATPVTFGTTGIPLQVGDYVYADGLRVKGGEVSKVEAARFKVGTINTSLSVVDTSGRYTTKVYDPTQVGTIFDPTAAFAPKYMWFKATGLTVDTNFSPAVGEIFAQVQPIPAKTATFTGTGAVISNTAMAGLTLHLLVTIDGVVNDVTFTFTGGPFADMAAVAAAIGNNITGVTASDVGGQLKLETIKAGRLQDLVSLGGTADDIFGFGSLSNWQSPGVDASFPAMVKTTGQVPTTTTLTGKILTIKISNDGGVTFPTTRSHTFVSEGTPTQIAAELNADSSFNGVNQVFLVSDVVGTELRIRYDDAGANAVIKVDASSTAIIPFLSFIPDQSGYGLNGSTLSVRLDKNPHTYAVSFSSHSFDLAMAEINNILGYTATGTSSILSLTFLSLSSQLRGLGASVEVLNTPAAHTLGLNLLSVTPGLSNISQGSGRPLPDARLDDTNSLVIGPQIVRDLVTGYPLDQDMASATLYVQFKALRKDVSAIAKVAGVLNISDTDTLSTTLDPLTEDNPLGLATFLCMLNAPNFEVKALGIDEVTAAAPNGTAEAYTRAAAMLESEEVYTIAPLSQDSIVRDLFLAHCLAMSEPEQTGERIVFFNGPMPTEKNPTVAVSGTSGNSTPTIGQLLLDQNPSAGLVAAGKNPALSFSVSDGVFIEFTNGGTFNRYNVKNVSGSLVNVNTTFAATENVDGFYSTVPFNFSVIDASYSLKVRGSSMIVPGSNPARLDYSLVASTVSDANAALLNRRGYSVFPDQILMDVNGVTKTLPGFYACAGIAGMVASQPPQQGFTNLSVAGIKAVKGTERFSKKQLNVMAAGGTFILIQDTVDGPVTCRHQLSTDTSAVETRELSITKVVDYTAKFLRLGIRRFIGTQNVNKDLLDTLGTTVQGLLAFLEDRGVLNGSNLNQIIQASDAPDTVVIDVTLDVPYPCNYIRLSLVV